MVENFASGATVEELAPSAVAMSRAAGRAPHAPAAGKTNAAERPVVGAAEAGINTLGRRASPTMEDRTISVLEGVRSFGNYAWTIGWVPIPGFPMPLPIPGVVAWAASKCGARGRALASAINLPIEVVRHGVENLNVRDLGKAPSAMLQHAASYAKSSESVRVQRLSGRLSSVATSAEGFMAQAQRRASVLIDPLARGARTAAKTLNKTAVGAGFVNVLGKVGKTIAGTKLSVAMIGMAAVGATGAAFLSRNRERKQANTMIDEMKEEIGLDHPFVKEAAAHASKRTKTGWLGAAMTSVGESVGVKIAGGGLDGLRMMPAMAAQIGLSGLADMVVAENDFLTACNVVKHAPEVPVEQLAPAYTMLLTVKDSVKHNGIEHNHLAKLMGHELAAKRATFVEVANLVRDDKAFTAFAAEVKAKHATPNNVPQLAKSTATETVKSEVQEPVHGKMTAVEGHKPAANDGHYDHGHSVEKSHKMGHAEGDKHAAAAHILPGTNIQVGAENQQHDGRVTHLAKAVSHN